MKIRRTLASLVVAAVGAVAFAGGEEWMQDFEAAKAKAQAEKKDLLIDFTGSDWCGWCIKLDKEVFAHDSFQESIQKEYVLVSLDFPRNETLITPEIKAQNEELQKKYAVQGFPTIFLTDASGRPYAQTGYQRGGPEKYLEHIAELRDAHTERNGLMERAGQAEGLERAKLLDEALGTLEDGVLMSFYGDEIDQIVVLDADNEAGLKGKYEGKRLSHALDQTIQAHMMNQDFEGLVAAMDKTISQSGDNGELKQKASFFKAIAYLNQNKLAEGLEVLKKAAEIDGGDTQVSAQIQAIMKQVEDAIAAQENEGDGDGDGDGDGGDGEGDGG